MALLACKAAIEGLNDATTGDAPDPVLVGMASVRADLIARIEAEIESVA
ncbi:hypothetical protein MKK58_06290 [Methylobacterium sp. J-078]|nr:hypothetical protein [Methylobacterium sp. J-078]MCJ2044140.1 hypothetical protein [Methylobacterium sp. J-078]